ncbi:MAG: SDR family oxidoreductase [Pseudomonadota bacterium]
MPVVLITGAGRGIGLEFARQYAEEGWTVLAGVRDPERAGDLFDIDGDVTVLQLDVTDPAAVVIMSERLAGIPIDLLINNAGVGNPSDLEDGGIDYAAWIGVLQANTLGPVRVTEAFLPHLRESEHGKIVTISSQMGSIGQSSGRAIIYRSSKAAVNAAMRALAMDHKGEGLSFAVVHPGWVKSGIGGAKAPLEPADSVAGMRQIISELDADKSGRFWNYDGSEIPW